MTDSGAQCSMNEVSAVRSSNAWVFFEFAGYLLHALRWCLCVVRAVYCAVLTDVTYVQRGNVRRRPCEGDIACLRIAADRDCTSAAGRDGIAPSLEYLLKPMSYDDSNVQRWRY